MTTDLSIIIASCLLRPEREQYLDRTVAELQRHLPHAEILIAFDRGLGKQVDGCKCYTHYKGLGHSWNWGLRNASHDTVLQLEDDWLVGQDLVDHLPAWSNIVHRYGGIMRLTHPLDYQWAPGKTMHSLEGPSGEALTYYRLNKPSIPEHWSRIDPNSWNIYYYCNHPHLKEKALHDKIGYYAEEVPVPRVELDMCTKYLLSDEPVFLSSAWETMHIGQVSSAHTEILP